jgi:hypothetical protein
MSRTVRTHLPARAALITVAAAGALALTACGGATKAPNGGNVDAPNAAVSGAAGAPGASASPGDAAGATPSTSSSAGALPDICTLLSKAEVTGLTGEQVTIMTNDGGTSPGSRYCQWQLSTGQLTVTATNETRDGFDIRNKQSTPVDGIGEAAYSLAGHLYVHAQDRTVDVYVSSESSDDADLRVEKDTAAKVLPRLNQGG